MRDARIAQAKRAIIDKTTSEASEVYEDDFETGDSGLEELILEAGPAPRSKVRKEQERRLGDAITSGVAHLNAYAAL